ncbi:MAG: hypothetical protein COS36_04260 [Candidatus Altarchaeum sp. CG03_land_8_20_14_0_80_32_618]|nr:MAG: hypothetical protein AUK59_01585 [Candidatus Altarchaeum sp. CG2_30_32_3053]PIV27867.1 MAG: hypothetical protein COS36_04260 [Candidatus Altarchaeum sp. CG03_land_8_20_14_0_80_32_618]PJC14426.1 MAG: hypothetical protein CO063_02730 [Candidatus Altarchaeum sp. CG_4_9_14_0_8_um_filter_32_206]
MEKIVLIGAGYAGFKFMEELKRQNKDKNTEILWLSKENFMTKKWLMDSYIVKDKDEKVIVQVRDFIKEKGINVHWIEDEIETVDTQKKEITGKKGKYNYNKLIIATGSKAKLPRIECAESVKEKITAFNSFYDFKKVKENLKDSKNVAIIGAGPIGFEMSVNLSKKFNVSLIEFELDIMLALLTGKPLYRKITGKILDLRNVHVYTLTRAYKFEQNKLFCDNIETKENFYVPSETIVFAAGVKQNLPVIDGYAFETEKNILICNDFGEAWIRDENGRRKILNDVCAIGDSCYYLNIGNYPASAMFAERSGKNVARNIFQSKCKNKKRLDFNPSLYSKFLDMILRRLRLISLK